MAKEVRINDNTPDVMRKIKGLSGNTLKDFVEKIVDIAKDSAPYDSGNHRSSIGSEFFGLRANRSPKAARAFSQSGYGGYLEFGTSRMPSRPHFRRGVNGAIKEFDEGKKWGE